MSEWSGADWASVIAASGATFVSVGAFIMGAWNNRIAKATHLLVNSNMEEFKKALIEKGILKEEAAEASGVRRGVREEKADQAVRDEARK